MIGANGSGERNRMVVNISEQEQKFRIEEEKIKCLEYIVSYHTAPISNATHCPPFWDDLLCWPDTPAGSVAVQSCPDYIQAFKPWENATRHCMEDGTWFFNPLRNRTWTDFRFCSNKDYDEPTETPSDFFKAHMGRIQLMYNMGYGISLASLVLSVLIMFGFKKLHCPRNTIHLNLFISFIFRASFSFMKENLLVEGVGFPSDVIQDGDGPVIFRNDSSHWECKLFFTCFYYILGANYMWIFAEALYLHMLISVAVFSERSSVKWYLLLGWGIVLIAAWMVISLCFITPLRSSFCLIPKSPSPLLFVVPWVVVRATLENVYCWNTHPTTGYFWIMRGPIVLSIVVNFAFFLNIIRVLFTKLNAVNSPEAKKYRYRKLAKSTLVLIPLFGVHYIIFAGLPKDVNPVAELIQLYFEMFFNSVQGFFVALLFCFLNGEVQSEIKKKWHRFRLTRLHHLPKGRSNSHNLTYATYLSRGARESNASVTQFQETRDAGNGINKPKHSTMVTQDANTVLLPLSSTGNGNRIMEESEPMIHQTNFSTVDIQNRSSGYS